jgi:hypothetical protein
MGPMFDCLDRLEGRIPSIMSPLFPQASVTVHHGGAGATAAAGCDVETCLGREGVRATLQLHVESRSAGVCGF